MCGDSHIPYGHQFDVLQFNSDVIYLELRAQWASLVAQIVKNLPALQETQVGSLGWEEPLEKGMATPLQYSCLENPMDSGAWHAAIQGVAKSRTRLSD